MGTARGSTQGSWRPLAASVTGLLSRSTVSWAEAIVAVGLNATRITMSSPLLMPPCTPPERLEAVRGRPSGPGVKGSLWSRPVMDTPAKPEPISKPLAAGSDRAALAKSASSLSNTGSPSPGGTLRATHSTIPPSELPSRRAASMASVMASACSGDGHRVASASTSAKVTAARSMSAVMVPTWRTQASTSTLAAVARSWRAMAPAATRPMVSRALARPPPCQLRMPYLASVV